MKLEDLIGEKVSVMFHDERITNGVLEEVHPYGITLLLGANADDSTPPFRALLMYSAIKGVTTVKELDRLSETSRKTERENRNRLLKIELPAYPESKLPIH